jgi:hypothetical protein
LMNSSGNSSQTKIDETGENFSGFRLFRLFIQQKTATDHQFTAKAQRTRRKRREKKEWESGRVGEFFIFHLQF